MFIVNCFWRPFNWTNEHKRMARKVSHAIKKRLKNISICDKTCLNPCHFHHPCYKSKLSELHFPELPRTCISTRIWQTWWEVRGTVHLWLLLRYKHRDRSAVKSISNVECTAFSLIFQIQWKHPYDSLPCLILNTFPLSLCSQRDVYERP